MCFFKSLWLNRRVNRYNGLNRWNNIYVSVAVRVVVFMSNGSARALLDNGSGVLSIICRFIKPNPCNMTSAALGFWWSVVKHFSVIIIL